LRGGKSGEDFRSAQQERNRSKVGRMARLRGEVETVERFTPPSDEASANVEGIHSPSQQEDDMGLKVAVSNDPEAQNELFPITP
jgi:hypothetical protein